MDKQLSPLDQVKADAMRITLKRIRDNAEEQGLPVPPRAAHGNVVLPKPPKEEAVKPVEAEEPVEPEAEEVKEAEAVEPEAPKKGKK